jgi:isopenicillin N synthase-like dioxygenase
VPFFYEPRFDSIISPVVENKENPTAPDAKPVCFGNFLIDKIGSSYQYDIKK